MLILLVGLTTPLSFTNVYITKFFAQHIFRLFLKLPGCLCPRPDVDVYVHFQNMSNFPKITRPPVTASAKFLLLLYPDSITLVVRGKMASSWLLAMLMENGFVQVSHTNAHSSIYTETHKGPLIWALINLIGIYFLSFVPSHPVWPVLHWRQTLGKSGRRGRGGKRLISFGSWVCF